MESSTQIGHYTILSSIGKGGMDEVWKARDARLGREVAIKTLPREVIQAPDVLARFRREARAASALNHPNICTVYDLDEHNGEPFIVMELLTGETLRDRLARGPLSMDEALELGRQLADDLAMIPVEGDGEATWRLTGRFAERNAELSPAGRWMAYQADESGEWQVYVRPFPGVDDDQVAVSNDGEIKPLWSRDGSELFYLRPGAAGPAAENVRLTSVAKVLPRRGP